MSLPSHNPASSAVNSNLFLSGASPLAKYPESAPYNDNDHDHDNNNDD